jgi:hypothetical protein
VRQVAAKSDIKRDRGNLYAPRAGGFQLVDVPELPFLMVDGKGDPNTSGAYADAVAALFAVSYAVKFASKRQLDRDYVVAPLEGLWSAADPAKFVTRAKDDWEWTMMITQPEWITSAMVEAGADAKKVRRPRFERLAEGLAVQVLHIGSFDDEGPLLDRLHHEFMPANGLTFNGPHHEIYLSDPRRTEPAKLRTILRQPVSAVSR